MPSTSTTYNTPTLRELISAKEDKGDNNYEAEEHLQTSLIVHANESLVKRRLVDFRTDTEVRRGSLLPNSKSLSPS